MRPRILFSLIAAASLLAPGAACAAETPSGRDDAAPGAPATPDAGKADAGKADAGKADAGKADAAKEAPAKAKREAFTAFAVHMGGNLTPVGSSVVDIVIDRWSTPEERAALIAAFKEKGQDGLLDALQRMKRVGYLKMPDKLGYSLYYAVQRPDKEGGRRILIATDRKIGYFEFDRGARSLDYPFTLMELRLDKDGNGEGKVSVGTKISVNAENQLELENYGMQPVQLNKIRRTK